MKQQIIEIICERLGITEAQMYSKKRYSKNVHARFLLFKWQRKNEVATFEAIAKSFGVHHSTVIHGIQVINNDIKYIPDVRAIWNDIKDMRPCEQSNTPPFTSMRFAPQFSNF